MNAAQPIRSKMHLKQIKDYYLLKKEYRNYLLVVMGLCTALRISDMRRLSWDMVFDFTKKKIRKTIHLIEKKTGKEKIIALNPELVKALHLYYSDLGEIAEDQPLLLSNRGQHTVISRIHAYRIIRKAGESVNTDTPVGCHSLRKTFGYFAWNGGVSPAILMDIFNHSSMSVTRRYLGVSQDDKNKVYMRSWC